MVEGLYDTSSITFDEQGRMIVLQFANDYYPGGREGKLLRVEQDGSITTLLDGLHTPGGVIHVGNGVVLCDQPLRQPGRQRSAAPGDGHRLITFPPVTTQ